MSPFSARALSKFEVNLKAYNNNNYYYYYVNVIFYLGIPSFFNAYKFSSCEHLEHLKKTSYNSFQKLNIT